MPLPRAAGVGRHLITAIERGAKGEGVAGLLLETGARSVEAIGLYRRLGYAGRGPFGAYGSDPLSVFMEKPLAGV